MSKIKHIVWDWNGTLFDDQDLVLAATNASLAAIGVDRHITNDRYKELYQRPMEDFYAALIGFPVAAAQWPVLDAAFAEYYLSRVRECGLSEDALAAMDAWSPRSQSLLSMFGHEDLLRLTRDLELHGRFHRIDGRPAELDFGPKAKYLVKHLEHLRAQDPELTPDQVALIGDCADDAYAAFHVGAQAVLYTGGSSSRSVLEKVGVPVVDTLSEAVTLLAESGVSGPGAAQ
ncbi:MAG TPA: HAD hydrolase-like protein [Actinocrinis sp.]|jgi:phosphoglycolate phosphatase-like HAD superfamily hydrolase|uniref:HAD family hydrolase n=1 Tax=Actinocrinis sp. TaxID=1920516 RepID=UPI002D50DF2F|nr:HAD hydrolase-like protein [Actinocrinis sp.]HZU55313.1 HAD hydrolase-like protein [Actinocrinis sp.]